MKYAFDYIWFKVTTIQTWKKALKWLATGAIIVAATTITIFPAAGLRIEPFIMFLTGHVIWGVFAIAMKEWSLFFLNSCFIIIDAAGIIIRL